MGKAAVIGGAEPIIIDGLSGVVGTGCEGSCCG